MDFSSILDFCNRLKRRLRLGLYLQKLIEMLYVLYSSRLSDSGRICVQYLIDIEDYKAINIIAELLGFLDRWDELVAIMAKI